MLRRIGIGSVENGRFFSRWFLGSKVGFRAAEHRLSFACDKSRVKALSKSLVLKVFFTPATHFGSKFVFWPVLCWWSACAGYGIQGEAGGVPCVEW